MKGFYSGLSMNLILCLTGALQMYSYEVMTHTLGYESGINKKITWDNMLVPFIIGGTSKSLASATLIPINVVRMRLQMKRYSAEEVEKKGLRVTENTVNEIQYKGITDTFQKIYKHEGVRGFYKGLTPLIMKVFPSSGIFFLAYELTLSALNPKTE